MRPSRLSRVLFAILLTLFSVGSIAMAADAVAPTITTQPASVSVTEGQTATFSVTASGSPLFYTWKKNGVIISGATSASYTTGATTVADSGAAYSVVVRNGAGVAKSTAAILTVNSAPAIAAPVITRQPPNKTVTEGETAKFTVKASGEGTITYQWRKNGTDIAGATLSSYTTPATTLADSGSFYNVVVGNEGGSITSAVKKLTVNPAAIPTPTATPSATPSATPTPTPGVSPTPPPVVTETFWTNPDGSQLQWDIYLPTGPVPEGGWPAVVLVHGGGFHTGGPAACANAGNDVANAGYIGLAVTYRLAPSPAGTRQLILGQPEIYVDHVTGIFPDQGDDVATAVRFARNPPTTSAIYGLVNGLVGAIGGSAGGTHATWVATHGSITDDKVNVAVSLSGAYDAADFDDAWSPGFKNNWLSYVNVSETDVEALNAASPAFADLTGASPLFLIASLGDSMPPRQLPNMVAALDAAGITNYQQLIISGDLHSFNYWDQVDIDGLTIGEKAIAFLDAGFSQAIAPGQ